MKYLFWLSLIILNGFHFLYAAESDRHVVLITIDGFPAYMSRDPKTPIPRIRQLAAEGCVAEGMRTANPTVTWPNHTTLVTGVRANRHSVLFNGILVRGEADQAPKVDPKRDKADLVAVPTLYDLLHGRGLRTAGIDWPCTRNSASLDDDFPDSPENVLHTTPALRRELVAQRILSDETDASFAKLTGPGRDEVWTQAACWVIKERKPNLLLLHLLNTDGIHHRYGPQSPASYTALALADSYVGRIIDALDAAGIRSQTTLFVTADHGFANATNVLQPNVLLKQSSLLEIGATNQITKARVQVVPEGGSGMIYLNNPGTREEDRQRVRQLFSGKEGIQEILEPAQFAAAGLPSPEQNRGMADLVLIAKDGYAINGSAAGSDFVVPVAGSVNAGYHGYIASNSKMDAPFIAAGRAINKNTKVGMIDNIDVAPTIAHLFDVKLEAAEGKVLTEILSQ